MKRSRLLTAVISAIMFVLATCCLVACDKDAGDLTQGQKPPVGDTGKYTITFVYGNGTGTPATAQTANGKLASLPTPTAPTGKKFDGWFTAATGGTQVTVNTVFTKSGSIYARYSDNGSTPPQEYTITFEYGKGTGTPASAQTANGKLASLPTPTAPTGKKFDGWFTAATGGTKVTTDTTFTGNDSIYAQYSDDQGGGDQGEVTSPDSEPGSSYASVGATPTYALTKSFDADDGDTDADYPTLGKQYIREGLVLDADTTLSFTIDGTAVEFYINADCKGLKEKKKDASSVTTAFKDTYDIYLKFWSDSSKWTITMMCRNNEDPIVTIGGEPIAANTAYLVGTVASANISWDTWQEGAIKLTEGVSGFTGKTEYNIKDVSISAGDSFKFILVGATTDDITWVNTLGNTKGNLEETTDDDGNTNITVVDAGIYDFYISFEDGKIYYDYTPA